jgi:molybdopterin synthase catalytic subunit
LPVWWSLENTGHARAGLAYITQELLSGALPARDANAAAGAISALVGVIRDSDLERRIQMLEGLLERRSPK